MAASSSRGGDRSIHQDYIARIRYSNTLPPPPNPPKLLDIPNTGLASGQYTTPGFASRLAREQPLNIEADAELGMPLDLVGMPGIFDGDESSIQAPLHPPAPHPHDRALLRPLSSLGKPKTADSGVSFLRRTEYISSHTGKSRFDSTTSRSLIHNTGSRTAPRNLPNKVDKDSLEYIQAQVERSFDLANSALQKPATIRHPSKPSVKLLGSYPFLPDLSAFSDLGSYITVKFSTNPVAPSSTYDTRIENGVLRYLRADSAAEAAYAIAVEAHDRDPARNPQPEPLQDFEFFIPQTPKDAAAFKRKYDAHTAAQDADAPYTNEDENGEPCFRFKRLRAYETAAESGSRDTMYDEEVAVALTDGKGKEGKQRGAYYYPVGNRFVIRPQRKKNIDNKRYGAMEVESEDVLDFLDIKLRGANEAEAYVREAYIADPSFPGAEYLIEEQAREEGVGEGGTEDEQGVDGQKLKQRLERERAKAEERGAVKSESDDGDLSDAILESDG